MDEIRTRIAAIYDLPIENVNAEDGSYTWSSNGVDSQYLTRAPFTDKEFSIATLHFTERLPSMDQVLECLGTPDSYGAWYYGPPEGDPILLFNVFYEQEGIAAQWSQPGKRGQPPPLNGSTLAEGLSFVMPKSPEETVEELGIGLGGDRITKVKPWPGSWDKIEIDIEPSAR